jgi:hypothetical protein
MRLRSGFSSSNARKETGASLDPPPSRRQ